MNLSIIIPVYNVEKYLSDCLASVLPQMRGKDELILVDDCSPDKSGDFCDRIAAQYPCVKVIHHEANLGLSEARNSGLRIATGDYITFIDSDDFIAPDTLTYNRAIISANPHIDVLEYPVEVDHGASSVYTYRPGNNDEETYSDWLRRKGYRHSYAWNKIYRRTLWQGIEFPPHKYVEDLYTIPYVMERAHSIYASTEGKYYYCKRKQSICSTPTLQFYEDHLDASVRLFLHLQQSGLLTRTQLDILYCETNNPQIVYRRKGGTLQLLPAYKPAFRSVFAHGMNLKTRIKMLYLLLTR